MTTQTQHAATCSRDDCDRFYTAPALNKSAFITGLARDGWSVVNNGRWTYCPDHAPLVQIPRGTLETLVTAARESFGHNDHEQVEQAVNVADVILKGRRS